MGSMTFTRANPVPDSIFNVFGFDSEPLGTIARSLGMAEESIELREKTSKNGRFLMYDVYGQTYPGLDDGRPVYLLGELKAETRESIWERMR